MSKRAKTDRPNILWIGADSLNRRILGAYGYSTEYPVARFYRDTPTYYIVEGSANICKWIIALDQLGIRKANR